MSSEPSLVIFSKPFIDAAKNIFSTMVFCELEPQKPFIKTDSMTKGDITAILGLSGEFDKDGQKIPYKAMLVIAFPYQTYFKVASAMLSETYTTYHPDIYDLGGEIVNMVMGNAKRDLKSLGYSSNMAIPSIIKGSHSIKYPAGTTIVVIPFKSPHGELFMELCYSSVT
jgi:chemotaxis protein CheX